MASAPLTIVIGAGISGLTCAYALKKSGQKVLLLEASARPGGVIQSVEENGYLFELGPQSFSATSELAELCQDLLLTEQVLETPRGAPRYVLINRKLVNVPLSPALLTSGLLSWGTKLTFLRDILGKTSPPETDESIAAFVRRKFSAQLLDRLVGPFISGIYAGDPEQLSLRAAFPRLYEAEKVSASVIRGGLKLGAKASRKTVTRPRTRQRLLSFRGGNETLVGALAAALGPALRCNVEVSEVRSAGNKFQIGTQSAAGSEEMTCHRVVLATPTDASAQILRGMVPAASAALESILYAPVAVVSLAYKQQQVARVSKRFRIPCTPFVRAANPGLGLEFVAIPRPRAGRPCAIDKLRGRRDRSISNKTFAGGTCRIGAQRNCANSKNHRRSGKSADHKIFARDPAIQSRPPRAAARNSRLDSASSAPAAHRQLLEGSGDRHVCRTSAGGCGRNSN